MGILLAARGRTDPFSKPLASAQRRDRTRGADREWVEHVPVIGARRDVAVSAGL